MQREGLKAKQEDVISPLNSNDTYNDVNHNENDRNTKEILEQENNAAQDDDKTISDTDTISNLSDNDIIDNPSVAINSIASGNGNDLESFSEIVNNANLWSTVIKERAGKSTPPLNVPKGIAKLIQDEDRNFFRNFTQTDKKPEHQHEFEDIRRPLEEAKNSRKFNQPLRKHIDSVTLHYQKSGKTCLAKSRSEYQKNYQ